jgi:hypothetical protein
MLRRGLMLGSAMGLVTTAARAQRTCFDVFDRCFNTTAAGPSLTLDFANNGADARLTTVRAAGGATTFDVSGALVVSAANTQRIDFDSVTHAARGLLVEESRTNLLLNSGVLATQSVTTAATAYTLSFYGTGTVTLTGTSTAGPLVGSGAFPARVTQTFTPTAGTLTLTVTGSVLNASLEAGALATSWISTAGTAVTRAADVVTLATGSWFNPATGTLAADAVFGNTAATAVAASLSDGGTSNRVRLGRLTGGAMFGDSVAATVTSTFLSGGSNTPPAVAKIAYAFGGVANAAAANGTSLGVGTATPPVGINTLTIGSGPAAGQFANGWTQRLRYWPRALSTAELQAATT